MGLFANFVERVQKRKLDELSARAEMAGARGVEVAQSLCPVKTGFLRSSIGYTWRQSDMTLVLHADASYAHMINLRYHFMDAGWAAMRQIFTGGTSEIQFATLSEKYQPKARLLSGKNVIIGHRRPVKFKR